MMMMDNSLSNDKLVIEDLKKNADMVFLIITGCFIFCKSQFDTHYFLGLIVIVYILVIKVGFAFFECSFVRAKNVTSVLFRNYFDSGMFLTQY